MMVKFRRTEYEPIHGDDTPHLHDSSMTQRQCSGNPSSPSQHLAPLPPSLPSPRVAAGSLDTPALCLSLLCPPPLVLRPARDTPPPRCTGHIPRKTSHTASSDAEAASASISTPPSQSVTSGMLPMSTRTVSTQLSTGTLKLQHVRSKGVQTKILTIDSSTQTDSSWLDLSSTPVKAGASGVRKRQRLEMEEGEEEDVDISDISLSQPHDSTYDPGASATDVSESNEVGGSFYMEKEGLKRGLDLLEANSIEVDYIVTDRHTQVKTFLRGKNITQYYDVWHLEKGTVALYKVEKLLVNKRVLGDVKKLSSDYQTSSLEAFHSVIIRFAPKSVVYPFVGMMCSLPEPGRFVEQLSAVPVPEDLSAQFEKVPKEVVVSAHVSRFSRAAGGPDHDAGTNILPVRIRKLLAYPEYSTCRNDHPDPGSK
ncbi:hypothetical protein WMY93_010452 [Mugilogobius chulae]|uniref:Uncharacterized protein n=1 Tax=Mugilogobius chulae TaxID=88201 RepID=A0AAW0PDN2_9GOBI